MSLKHAMAYIQKVSGDPALRKKIEELEKRKDLDDIAALGAGVGYDFTIEELRRAFLIDWEMRWHRFLEKPTK